jgi:hypothetical protein
VLALAANLPSPIHGALRVVGLLVGIGGAVCTFFSLEVVNGFSIVHDTGAGFWLGIAAFVIVGIGALIGPPEDRTKPLPR